MLDGLLWVGSCTTGSRRWSISRFRRTLIAIGSCDATKNPDVPRGYIKRWLTGSVDLALTSTVIIPCGRVSSFPRTTMCGWGGEPMSSMTEPRSMIDLLRVRTAAHHRGLESGLRIEERLSRVDTRGPLIDGYNAFYSECDAVLRSHLWDMPDLTFVSRFRSRKIPSKTELACAGNPLIDLISPRGRHQGRGPRCNVCS